MQNALLNIRMQNKTRAIKPASQSGDVTEDLMHIHMPTGRHTKEAGLHERMLFIADVGNWHHNKI